LGARPETSPRKKPKTAKNTQLLKAGRKDNRRPKQGRPKLRWEDDARNDLRKMGVKNWKQRVQERKQWKEIIEQAKTHKEL
jgi:hypothetical protein